MKKRIVILASFIVAICAVCLADEYSYLTITANDASETSVALSSLRKITFSSGSMVLTNNDNTTESFTLANLAKMYFSNNASGIEYVRTDAVDWSGADIYNLNGVKMNVGYSSLPKGVYIVKSQSKTQKIVKK